MPMMFEVVVPGGLARAYGVDICIVFERFRVAVAQLKNQSM
jgi:hypothetical protein